MKATHVVPGYVVMAFCLLVAVCVGYLIYEKFRVDPPPPSSAVISAPVTGTSSFMPLLHNDSNVAWLPPPPKFRGEMVCVYSGPKSASSWAPRSNGYCYSADGSLPAEGGGR
jgi:hypothetical protein